MNFLKCNWLEINKTKLSDQTKFRLDEIKKIENYVNSEINQRKLCNKKLSKYVSAFNYIDNILTILNATKEECVLLLMKLLLVLL